MREVSILKSERMRIPLVFLVFLGVNLLFYNLSSHNASLVTDSPSYLKPARLLVQEGVYHSIIRLPVYPIFLALFYVFTEQPQQYVVLAQVVMTFCIALVAYRISKYLFPQFGVLVLILTAFNSNALLHAHKILPDTLFSLLFVLFLLFLIRSYHYRSFINPVLCGLAAGLMALTRGNGAYIIVLMPVFMILGRRISPDCLTMKCFKMSFVSVLTAVLVITPWLCYNWSTRGILKINSHEYVNFAIHDNLVRIEYLSSGLSKREAADVIRHAALQKAGIDPAQWQDKTIFESFQLVKTYAGGILLDYPPKVLFYAGVRSLGYFFLDPGYKNFAGHLDVETLHLGKDKLGSDVSIRVFFSQLFFSPEPATKVYALFVVILLFLRLLAFFGLVASIADRNWELVIICGGFILYFALISGLIGYARYRLPADPLLVIPAVYGLRTLTRIFKKQTKVVKS